MRNYRKIIERSNLLPWHGNKSEGGDITLESYLLLDIKKIHVPKLEPLFLGPLIGKQTITKVDE